MVILQQQQKYKKWYLQTESIRSLLRVCLANVGVLETLESALSDWSDTETKT